MMIDEARKATRAGYVCRNCGGPAPIGIGDVDTTLGAFERSLTVTRCPCGTSTRPMPADGWSVERYDNGCVIYRSVLGMYAAQIRVDRGGYVSWAVFRTHSYVDTYGGDRVVSVAGGGWVTVESAKAECAKFAPGYQALDVAPPDLVCVA